MQQWRDVVLNKPAKNGWIRAQYIYTTTSLLQLPRMYTNHISWYVPALSCNNKVCSRIHQTTKLTYQSMLVPFPTCGSVSLYGSIPPHIKRKIENIDVKAQLTISDSERIRKTEPFRRKHVLFCSCVSIMKKF